MNLTQIGVNATQKQWPIYLEGPLLHLVISNVACRKRQSIQLNDKLNISCYGTYLMQNRWFYDPKCCGVQDKGAGGIIEDSILQDTLQHPNDTPCARFGGMLV